MTAAVKTRRGAAIEIARLLIEAEILRQKNLAEAAQQAAKHASATPADSELSKPKSHRDSTPTSDAGQFFSIAIRKNGGER